MRFVIGIAVVIPILLGACSPLSKKSLTRTFRTEENNLQDHVGFQVYDVNKEKVLFEYKSDHYFTPASNVKVLTLFASLQILKDSIPAIRYREHSDSLIFWGLGDPSFLNKECYNNLRLFNFLKTAKAPLYFSQANFYTTVFGRGWAWDDYNDYYSTERSPFPIYGNTFSVYPLPDQFLVVPKYFERHYSGGGETDDKPKVVRDIAGNRFFYHEGRNRKYKDFTVPFHAEAQFIAELLQDTLHRKVTLIKKPVDRNYKILFSTPVDSLYKVMMIESDNHIAEQLLLNCAAVISDSLKPEPAIRYIQDKYFSAFKDKVIWVDGSGLSRYNLLTPRFMVALWKEIYRMVPRERLFSLLATGGKGTLKKWYASEEPYVFGKTGTLSNNHCLSGFLVTKKKKTLIFSFMNANYVSTTDEVRTKMQRILNLYYENY